MEDNRVKPTTQVIGVKANQLLHELAVENGIASRYFLTQVLLREARSEATMLDGERLKARLQLINEVNDELVDLINNPPKDAILDWDYSTNPKSIYMRVWQAHKRLGAQGKSEEEIHNYCIERYGLDYPVKDMPQKTPKNNPEWVGGGVVAQKIKTARETSRKIEVQ